MTVKSDFRRPPRETNEDGAPRRVGVELEFAAVSAHDAAQLIRRLFGGEIRQEDPHRYHVENTGFGTFTCELDTRHAHASAEAERRIARDAFADLVNDLEGEIRKLYGDVSSLLVPCEIVCPPIPFADLPRLDSLVEALIQAGAEGTHSSLFYAFGLQLNPEIATRDPDWLLAMLKSYLLCSDWIRAIIEVDATRRLTAFADAFPAAYMEKVVAPDYRPDLDRLMDDYLSANPTRNRELDLLPLFAWIDEDRVRRAAPGQKIARRPTFHYRLPNADLGRPGWSVSLEWNRWQVIERLAERPEVLAGMARDWTENRARLLPRDWGVKASEWLVLA